jgi:hypothetical protein
VLARIISLGQTRVKFALRERFGGDKTVFQTDLPQPRCHAVPISCVPTGCGAARRRGARARRSAVISGFTAGAAALLGAAACWFAACAGRRIRDGEVSPHALLDWGRPIGRI